MPAGAGGLATAVAQAGADGKADSAMRRFAARDAVVLRRARVGPDGDGGVWRRVIEAVGGEPGAGAARQAKRRSTGKTAW